MSSVPRETNFSCLIPLNFSTSNYLVEMFYHAVVTIIIGETHLRMVPNAEHSLYGHQEEVTTNILTFINLIQNNTPRPSFNYTMVKSNTTASITVYTYVETNSCTFLSLFKGEVQPAYVRVWSAETLSFTYRDFRLITCWDIEKCINPVIWTYEELQGNNGVYTVSMDAPEGNLIQNPDRTNYKNTYRV